MKENNAMTTTASESHAEEPDVAFDDLLAHVAAKTEADPSIGLLAHLLALAEENRQTYSFGVDEFPEHYGAAVDTAWHLVADANPDLAGAVFHYITSGMEPEPALVDHLTSLGVAIVAPEPAAEPCPS